MAPVQPQTYSRNEAAVVLGLSVRTIDHMIRDGDVESVLVRNRRLILRRSVDDLLAIRSAPLVDLLTHAWTA